jgi:hypothetical protein
MKLAVLALSMLTLAAAPAFAASCSDWKATCESRGGGAACQAKFDKCMKSGTFTEGEKFGGATHSGLTKK